MERRKFLKLSTAMVATFAITPARSQPVAKEVRFGYQKTGVPVIARQQGTIEKRLAGSGTSVRWVEFTSGPPMMEAISNGQGILVPQNSSIKTIADLKGKRVGFTKGSSAHNVVVLTLAKAGLTYNDITPVYLTPPDAGPAFANGSIDAWAVWDPYFAIGEKKQNARILINAYEVGKTNAFFIANRDFANQQPAVLREVIAGLSTAATWAENNREAVAKSLHEVTGVPLDIQTLAASRASFAIGSLSEDVIETQQGVADSFYKLGLIPKPIAVRDIVWKTPQT